MTLSGARNNNQTTIGGPEDRRRSPPPKTTNVGTVEKCMGRTKNCPAYGKTCRHRHDLNHVQLMCRSKTVHDIDTAEKNIDYYGASGCDNSFSYDGHKEHFIDVIDKGRVSTFSHSPDRAFVSLALGPKKIPVQFKIDTGSEVNIISCKVLDKLNVQTPLEAPDC